MGWYLLAGGFANVLIWVAGWQGAGRGLAGLGLTLVAAPLLLMIPAASDDMREGSAHPE
jgi:hypothetical protein